MIADVGSVRISSHAITRYAERRGRVALRPQDRPVIEAKLRSMLERCKDDNPPLRLSEVHGPGRLYRCGQLTFVMTADSDAVITVLCGGQSGARSGQARNQAFRKARRARRDASDDRRLNADDRGRMVTRNG